MNMTEQERHDKAEALLLEYMSSPSLLRHCWLVSGAMGGWAKLAGEDVALWETVGLLHDFDYERYPEEHLKFVREIMSKRGWPEEIIHAVESHGWQLVNDVKPVNLMERVLLGLDEMCGFFTAMVLIKGETAFSGLSVKSTMKKLKDARFAAGVDRACIDRSADLLGMDREQFVAKSLEAVKELRLDELDLKVKAALEAHKAGGNP